MKESELRDILLKKLSGVVNEPYHIDTEVPVPYKHIYIPVSQLGTPDKVKLELWCFKQDIAIYKILFDKSVKQKESKITKNETEIVDVVLEKDSGQNSHHVGLPFVIIELKKEQPNTHEILTYSQKAEMIKTSFPYCRFLFLIFGKISARTYRHGIHFDEIISIKDIHDEGEIENLKEIIKKHFETALKDLERLTPSNYLR